MTPEKFGAQYEQYALDYRQQERHDKLYLL